MGKPKDDKAPNPLKRLSPQRRKTSAQLGTPLRRAGGHRATSSRKNMLRGAGSSNDALNSSSEESGSGSGSAQSPTSSDVDTDVDAEDHLFEFPGQSTHYVPKGKESAARSEKEQAEVDQLFNQAYGLPGAPAQNDSEKSIEEAQSHRSDHKCMADGTTTKCDIERAYVKAKQQFVEKTVDAPEGLLKKEHFHKFYQELLPLMEKYGRKVVPTDQEKAQLGGLTLKEMAVLVAEEVNNSKKAGDHMQQREREELHTAQIEKEGPQTVAHQTASSTHNIYDIHVNFLANGNGERFVNGRANAPYLFAQEATKATGAAMEAALNNGPHVSLGGRTPDEIAGSQQERSPGGRLPQQPVQDEEDAQQAQEPEQHGTEHGAALAEARADAETHRTAGQAARDEIAQDAQDETAQREAAINTLIPMMGEATFRARFLDRLGARRCRVLHDEIGLRLWWTIFEEKALGHGSKQNKAYGELTMPEERTWRLQLIRGTESQNGRRPIWAHQAYKDFRKWAEEGIARQILENESELL